MAASSSRLGLGALILGRGVQAVLSLGLLKILTTQLPQTEVAYYYFVVAVAAWYALLFLNPIGMWVNRHIIEWRTKYTWRSVFARLCGYHIVVGAVAAGVTLLLNSLFGLNETIPSLALAIGVAGSLVFQSGYMFLSGLQNILGERIKYSLMIAIGQTIVFASVCGVMLMTAPTIRDWFVLLSAGYFVAAVYFAFVLAKEFDAADQEKVPAKTPQLIQWHSLVTFCLPVFLVTLAMWTQTQGYRVVLSKTNSLEALALMGVGLGIAASIGATVESLVSQYLVPGYYKAVSEGEEAGQYAWRVMFSRVVVLMTLACFGLFCFSGPIVRLLTSNTYLNGQRFLQWGAAIEYFRILGNFVYLSFVGEKRVWRAIPAYGIGALVTVGFFTGILVAPERLELLVVLGLVFGGMANMGTMLWMMRTKHSWMPSARPLLWALALASPYALGLLLPRDLSLVWLFPVLVMAGVYGLFILKQLMRRQLL